jgi:hypothetical protein
MSTDFIGACSQLTTRFPRGWGQERRLSEGRPRQTTEISPDAVVVTKNTYEMPSMLKNTRLNRSKWLQGYDIIQ